MQNTELPEEPKGVPAVVDEPLPTKPSSSRRSLSSARRELNEQEFSSPAVQKLLLDDIDRLEEEVIRLKGFVDRFHAADKRASVLEARAEVGMGQEVISITCVSCGGALLGFAPSIWANQPTALVALVLGGILLACGTFAKVWIKV